jgi:putative membrane protein
MAHEEEMRGSTSSAHPGEHKDVITSKKVSDHLANERTFLAWLRTGLATITFGFVIERFGLALRELGLKTQVVMPSSVPFSAIIGISLTLLGMVMIVVALLNFLHIRAAIDAETFHPPARFVVVLTVLTSLIGLLLAVYLVLAM